MSQARKSLRCRFGGWKRGPQQLQRLVAHEQRGSGEQRLSPRVGRRRTPATVGSVQDERVVCVACGVW